MVKQNIRNNTNFMHIKDINGFSERVRLLMAEQKSVNSFAKRAGVTEGAIRNYLRGGVKPSQKVVEAIARTANVSAHWLVTGEGERAPEVASLLFGTPSARELMKLAIQDTEKLLFLLEVTLAPEQKAELTLNLFDYYTDADKSGTQTTPEKVVSFVEEKLKRLAS